MVDVSIANAVTDIVRIQTRTIRELSDTVARVDSGRANVPRGTEIPARLAAVARLEKESVAFLQAADGVDAVIDTLNIPNSALRTADELLEQAEELAGVAAQTTGLVSTVERAVLDTNFRALLDDVAALVGTADIVASAPGTTAVGVAATADDETFDAQVGTGVLSDEDVIAVVIPDSDLDVIAPGLSTANLLSEADATTTLTLLDTARTGIASARGTLEGQITALRDGGQTTALSSGFFLGVAAERGLLANFDGDIVDLYSRVFSLEASFDALNDFVGALRFAAASQAATLDTLAAGVAPTRQTAADPAAVGLVVLD